MTGSTANDGLRALFVSCTLEPSPGLSHTEGLMRVATEIMRINGVLIDEIRAVDHDIAPGVYPDMREHGFQTTRGRSCSGASWRPTSS